MTNIVVEAAADWTEEETERNIQTLKDMGMEDEVKRVRSLRSSAKRKGDLSDNPQPRQADDQTAQE